jgi:glutathione S-transferase
MPKLHHFPLCPFSRRARLCMGEYGIDVELVEERPWERREAFFALNPAGTNPVLVEDDGSAVAGIEAVDEYLEETRSGRLTDVTLFGGNPHQRAEVRRLVAWFDVKFNAEVTLNLVYEKIDRRFMRTSDGGGAPDMAVVRAGRENIRYHLEYIGYLTESRKWLAGEDLSHADLAAAAHLSCIDYLGDVPWEVDAHARDWYARIKSRPSFRSLLADHLTGMPPPKAYADLDF